jgi:hypothetical protein
MRQLDPRISFARVALVVINVASTGLIWLPGITLVRYAVLFAIAQMLCTMIALSDWYEQPLTARRQKLWWELDVVVGAAIPVAIYAAVYVAWITVDIIDRGSPPSPGILHVPTVAVWFLPAWGIALLGGMCLGWCIFILSGGHHVPPRIQKQITDHHRQ